MVYNTVLNSFQNCIATHPLHMQLAIASQCQKYSHALSNIYVTEFTKTIPIGTRNEIILFLITKPTLLHYLKIPST